MENEIYSLSGLTTINADEVDVSDLQADSATVGNLFVLQNETIKGNLTIEGDQILSGNVEVGQNLQVDQSIFVKNSGASSKIVMNYLGTGPATKAGIYYSQNGLSSQYPLLVSSSDGTQLVLSTPMNATFGDIRISPRILTSADGPNQIVLSKPDASSQSIDSDLVLTAGKTLSAPTVNSSISLQLNGVDYKDYFGVTGSLLTYDPGIGGTSIAKYGLNSSSIRGLFSSANNGLAIDNSTGLFTSVWDANSNSVYPKSGGGIKQLCLGFTGPGDSLAGIHVTSESGKSSLLLESTTGTWDPVIRLKNTSVAREASISYYSSADTVNISPSNGVETLQISPNVVKVRAASGNSASLELSTGFVQAEFICDPVGNFVITPSANTVIDHGTLTVNNSVFFGQVTSKGETINNSLNDSSSASVTFQKIRGSGNTLSGDNLGYFSANGYHNSSYRQAGYIAFSQSAVGANNAPSDIVFATTNTSDPYSVERMRLSRQGNLGIGSSIFGNPQYPIHIATSETSGIVSLSAQFAAQLPPNTSGSNRTRKWFGVNTNVDNSFFEDFYFYSNDGGSNSRFNYVGWGAAGRGYSFLSNGNGTFYIPSLGGSGNQYVGVDSNGTLYKAGVVSDRRLKTDICPFDCPLKKIEKLEWYRFKYQPVKKLVDEDLGNGQRYIVTDRPDVGDTSEQVGIMTQELLDNGLEDCVAEEVSKLGEKYYTLDDRRLQWYFNRTVASLIKWNRRQEEEIQRLVANKIAQEKEIQRTTCRQ